MRYACHDDYFAADPYSGDVFVAKNLQELFTSQKNFSKSSIIKKISVSACDMDEPVFCSNASISIIINDVNNYAPQFERVQIL